MVDSGFELQSLSYEIICGSDLDGIDTEVPGTPVMAKVNLSCGECYYRVLEGVVESVEETVSTTASTVGTDTADTDDTEVREKRGKREDVMVEDVLVEKAERYTVKFEKLDRGYRFRYGRYLRRDKTLVIDLEVRDRRDVETLIYEKLPLLFCYESWCDRLLEKCVEKAYSLSEFESGILKKISAVSSTAVKADVSGLEKLMDEMSEWHSQFFSRFMEFKELNERLFEAIAGYERVCRELQMRSKSYEEVRTLEYYESKFEQTLNGLRDLFSLMSLRLDTLRNREYLDLHRKTSSLQIAATVIEFVAVYYYTMKIWEHFSVKKLPLAVEFLLLFAFTVLVILLTDVVGEYIRAGRMGYRGVVVIASLLLVVLAMFSLSLGFF